MVFLNFLAIIHMLSIIYVGDVWLLGGICFNCEKLIRWVPLLLRNKTKKIIYHLIIFSLTTSDNTYYKHDINIVHLIFYHIFNTRCKSCGK